jgi:hypothetical protein
MRLYRRWGAAVMLTSGREILVEIWFRMLVAIGIGFIVMTAKFVDIVEVADPLRTTMLS